MEELFGVWHTVCKSCLEGMDINSGTREMGLGSGGVMRFSWGKEKMKKRVMFDNKAK